ncbi:MAG: cell division topological specificity factor MinE [Francisellaceae bacterium]|jgi:cell division topological specificity factor|nr:cell division topological specificity factor MinE [Francisellaceae bacterium]MBT6538833.1 cell division topological specificity factor MinE [Francisellaceae bacterium]
MNIFDFFRSTSKKSASKAKERLQIVISHQRIDNNDDMDFLANMRIEIMTVISKYIDVDPECINVQLQKQEHHSILELNVTLPETTSS